MKNGADRRKIFDAVDLLSVEENTEKNMATMIPVERITPFHDHPFHLYENERLEDMVESVREHGVLIPVIVQKCDSGYEMLSGHNRLNASKQAGLKDVPAIVKEGLTEEEAYVYVVETNVIQRSFAEMLPSEKAAVLAVHYEKMCCRGKRNDIIRELEILNGIEPKETCGHDGHRLKSRDVVAAEYGFSSRNAARYLRLNYLIQPFKDMVDAGKMGLVVAVDISYLTKEEQQLVCDYVKNKQIKIKPKMAEIIRHRTGKITIDAIRDIFFDRQIETREKKQGTELILPRTIWDSYFVGMDEEKVLNIVEQALAEWFGK